MGNHIAHVAFECNFQETFRFGDEVHLLDGIIEHFK